MNDGEGPERVDGGDCDSDLPVVDIGERNLDPSMEDDVGSFDDADNDRRDVALADGLEGTAEGAAERPGREG